MEPIAVIIPDRGDRKAFTDHCLHQIQRQTFAPAEIYHVNNPPLTDRFDLTDRIQEGVRRARKDEIDFCFIIENDDYYPDNYLEQMYIPRYDFIGIPQTIYYHIRYGLMAIMNHVLHSGLFSTGFRISSLEGFTWPYKNKPFLDIPLWVFARRAPRVSWRIPDIMPVGIKHGVGLCGGIGHQKNFSIYNEDIDRTWLKDHIRKESYQFYSQYFDK